MIGERVGVLAGPLALDAEGLEALHSLCTALAALRGHPGLLLALYDSSLLRDRLMAEIEARLMDWRFRILDAGSAPPDLLPWLASEIPAGVDAVFVIDLKDLPTTAKYLNYRREILVRLPYPVVFWLPYDREEELHSPAPDFWAFRRQTFRFRLFTPWLLQVSQKVAETGIPAETPDDRRAGIALHRQLLADLERTGAGETLLAARLHHQLGDLLRWEGSWAESRAELERALGLLGGLAGEDTRERAGILYSLGLSLYYLDEYDQALAHYGQALELFRAIGDRLGEANVQKALGDLALREARLGEARKHYEAALAIYPAIGDRLGEANVQQALGDLALREDRLGEARKHYEAALAIYPAIGDRLGEANTLASMSRLALREGQEEEARALLQQAVDLHAAIGSRYNVAADLGNFGLALRELGRPEEARPYLLQAAEVFAQLGLPQLAAQVLQAAGAPPLPLAVARLLPLLQGVAAVARGEIRGEAVRPVRRGLERLARERAALARALERVLAGERKWEALAEGLDEPDRQALGWVLEALNVDR